MTEQEVRVYFQPMNKTVLVPRDTPLLDALRQAGVAIESICGGKGLCRKCKVILTRGTCAMSPQPGARPLSPEEVAQGYCYACQATLTADAEFTIPVESRIDAPKILLSSEIKIGRIAPAVMRYRVEISPSEGLPFASPSIRLAGYGGERPIMSDAVFQFLRAATGPLIATVSQVRTPPEMIAAAPETGTYCPLYGMAIDLGTTTVVGCLVNLETGEIAETGSTLNRQITYGEELITRMGYAGQPEGLATMQRAAADSLNTVIAQVCSAARLDKTDIMDICVAGNTVMNHLLCGIDPQYLEMANVPVSRIPVIRHARDAGLSSHPEASVYCLPNVSRFVGGDAVGDVIASGMHSSDALSLLVDLGTNGEIILGNRDWMASVSCASGPAFEGAGITAGMRAMRGAIEHVRSGPATGEPNCQVIGNVLPRGICGSGIIDTAVVMLESGALDFAGRIDPRHPRVRYGSGGLEYVLVPSSATATKRDIVITQQDVDYLMDSKAAACGGIGVLLKKYKRSVADIGHVYLAGAFGAFTDIGNATRFGILPEFPSASLHPIGNGSLSGAYAALVSRDCRNLAEKVAHRMVYIDLLVDTDFMEEYAAALYIPGKKELFPGYFKRKERETI
jgi:uncharacterized 2Fe-2S/4Fe-4S cluster protein (DUF4445 family)